MAGDFLNNNWLFIQNNFSIKKGWEVLPKPGREGGHSWNKTVGQRYFFRRIYNYWTVSHDWVFSAAFDLEIAYVQLNCRWARAEGACFFLFCFMKDQVSSVFKTFWSNQTFHLYFSLCFVYKRQKKRDIKYGIFIKDLHSGEPTLDLNLVKNSTGVSSQVGKMVINIMQGKKLIVID